MTCLEKLKQEKREVILAEDGYPDSCPSAYGYLDDPDDWCLCSKCVECWDREIPETETIIKKEKENMPISVTKMTKAQLIEEIQHANEHVSELEKELKNMEKYKQYEDCADEIKAMHTAFMNSGFTDEQAFELIKTAMQVVGPAAMRGMRV